MAHRFEYGTFERVWDMFKTMHHKDEIPEPAFTVFALLGVSSPADRETVMRRIASIAVCCSGPEEFEAYLRQKKLPARAALSLKDDIPIDFKLRSMSHMKISTWASV
tara:strand:+ start:1798 stop:2118 length:321 start_codon:yes stop_codon:yes gene_type:complete